MRLKLWASLYLMVWLAFLEFIFVYVDVPGLELEVEVHVLLGVIIIILAFFNLRNLRRAGVPPRLARIAGTTAAFAVLQAILGFPLRVEMGEGMEATMRFIHLVIALAIITQASSVATSYDMWEEKEFEGMPETA